MQIQVKNADFLQTPIQVVVRFSLSLSSPEKYFVLLKQSHVTLSYLRSGSLETEIPDRKDSLFIAGHSPNIKSISL